MIILGILSWRKISQVPEKASSYIAIEVVSIERISQSQSSIFILEDKCKLGYRMNDLVLVSLVMVAYKIYCFCSFKGFGVKSLQILRNFNRLRLQAGGGGEVTSHRLSKRKEIRHLLSQTGLGRKQIKYCKRDKSSYTCLEFDWFKYSDVKSWPSVGIKRFGACLVTQIGAEVLAEAKSRCCLLQGT